MELGPLFNLELQSIIQNTADIHWYESKSNVGLWEDVQHRSTIVIVEQISKCLANSSVFLKLPT